MSLIQCKEPGSPKALAAGALQRKRFSGWVRLMAMGKIRQQQGGPIMTVHHVLEDTQQLLEYLGLGEEPFGVYYADRLPDNAATANALVSSVKPCHQASISPTPSSV